MRNIHNKTIYCKDNLDILKGINSKTVDMIYLDPPFNKNKSFHAPVGTSAEGSSFKDIFGSDDIDQRWMEEWRVDRPELYNFIKSLYFFADLSDASYIQYMAVRLIECHRVLKDTGSIFYHCDDTMQHYIKIMMDIIFGRKNFKNELNWQRNTANSVSGKRFGRVTDAILFYSKSLEYTFNNVYKPRVDAEKYYRSFEEETGRRYLTTRLEYPGNTNKVLNYKGKDYISSGWRWNQQALDDRIKKNPHLIHVTKNNKLHYKLYMDEDKGIPLPDMWNDIMTINMENSEKTGYPTQKPLALLRRIIECSTNEGDLVLDPFCGTATTCVAAEQTGREWVGIDISVTAYELVKDRLKTDAPASLFSEIPVHYTQTAPNRSEMDIREKKWVYIISNEQFPGEYKVGIATNWKSRLNSYQTSDPNRAYKMEYKIAVPNWLEIEKAVHDHFPNKHEWVQAELKEIKEYINEKINISNDPQ